MYDLIVVGGGPGGYVAAIRGAQRGLKTCLIEREHLGGICLNWGCIPTKALLRSADIYRLFQHAPDFGLKAEGISFDLGKIVARSRAVAGQLQAGVKHLLRKNKVEVKEGTARLEGGGKVSINGKEILEAKHIILATGAKARVLPGLEPDGKLIWTYKEAMTPDKLPESLLVIGSGAIGVEFASFYNALGVKVTLVEAVNRILPFEDAEIAAIAQKSFAAQGIKIITGAIAENAVKGADSVSVSLNGEKFTAQRVIVAAGVVANSENLGLEKTKAQLDRGFVVIDKWQKTAEEGLYAIGDLAGPPCLAHKASHEGIICVDKIVEIADVHPLDKGSIPACTYATPQIASVGLSEEKAKEKGFNIKVGRFPFIANGKAIALGEKEGLVKVIFDAKSGELLGAHLIGPEVTEMIQGYTVAKTLETTEAELLHTVFPHPTLSEAMQEAVMAAFGGAIHF